MTEHCLKQNAVQFIFDFFSQFFIKNMANHLLPKLLYIAANNFDSESFITEDDDLASVQKVMMWKDLFLPFKTLMERIENESLCLPTNDEI
jgi:hypothetical protein